MPVPFPTMESVFRGALRWRFPGLGLLLLLLVGSCVDDIDLTDVELPVRVRVDFVADPEPELSVTARDLPLQWVRLGITDAGTGGGVATGDIEMDPDSVPDRWRLHLDVSSSWETTLEGTLELIRILEGEVGEEERVEWAVELEPTPVTAEQESWEVFLAFGRGSLEELSVTQVQVSEPEGPVPEGEAFALSASAEGGPEEGARIFWGSEDPEVAEVDERGFVTALLPGDTRIIAASGQQWAAAEVQVLQRVSAVMVEPPAATATALGEEMAFTALPLDPRGAPVTDRELAVEWGVEDTGVAEHLGNGVFQAVGRGATEVLAVVEGVEGRATLTVEVESDGVFEGSLVVFDEQDLAEFAENGWVEVTGNLTIGGEESPLTSLSGLETLRRVGGAVRIRDNASLEDVSGLAGLEEVGRWFDVRFNGSLAELPPWPELRFIGADSATQVSMTIVQNPDLARIGGFPALEEAEGNLSISFNPVLADLVEFSSLRSLGGDLRVRGNSSLASFGGFPVLEAVGGSLFVLDNEALENLDAFSGLTSAIQDLHVDNNASLTSIQGLQNLGSATEAFPAVLGDFTVTDNPELPTSQAEDLAEALGVAGTVTISGNLDDSPQATVIAWVEAGGGAWGDPGNWSLGRTPIQGDTVEITLEGGYTVTLETDEADMDQLRLGGETGTPTLALTDAGLSVTGVLRVDPGGTVQAAGTTFIDAGMVDNAGTISVPGALMLGVAGESTDVINGSTGRIEVGPGGVAQLLLGDVGTFAHAGVLDVATPEGGAVVQGGTVDLEEGGSIGGGGVLGFVGSVVNLGATLSVVDHALSLQQVVLNGPGAVELPEATVHSWTDVTANTLVDNFGDLFLSGLNVMTQGFANRPGAEVVVAGATEQSETSLTLEESDGFFNQGRVLLLDPFQGEGRSLRLAVPQGTFVNEEGAFVEVGESLGSAVPEVVGTLVNRGTIQADHDMLISAGESFANEGAVVSTPDGGTVTVDAPFIHSGSLQVGSGVLRLARGGQLAANASIGVGAVLRMDGTTGVDTLQVQEGVQVTGEGFLHLSQGTLRLLGPAIVDRFVQTGGILSGSDLAVVAEWHWEGGLKTGPGTTSLGIQGIGEFRGPAVKQSAGRSFANQGTIVWTGDGDLPWNGGGTFTNASSGAFEIRTDADMLQTIENARIRFVNQGIVSRTAPGTTGFSAQLENAGVLEIVDGILRPDTVFLQLSDGVTTGTGTLDLATTGWVQPVVGTVAPGLPLGELTVVGDLPLDMEATTLFTLGGTAQGQFSRLVVTGDMVPNGTLEVVLAEGYEPVEGDSFPILSAAAFVESQFQEILLPELSGGLGWRIEETGTDFILHVSVP